ncbi:hypothetical protein Tco_0686574 [Tanacetum coccineum]
MTADTKAESMVSVTIQQDTSVVPFMTSPVIGPVPRPDSPNVHWPLPTTTTTTSATTTTTLPLPPQPQQGPSDPIIIKRMGELEELIANLVEENQALEERLDKQGSRINKLETMDLPKMIREQTVEFIDSQEIDRKINESVKEVVISSVKHAMRAPLRARFKDLPTSDMKEILLQRMLEENYDKGHADHRVAYEALQDSIRRDESEDFDVDKAQEETKKKSKQDSPKTPPGSPPSPPPPPPPPSGASGASGTTGASDSAQAPPPPPPSSSTHQGGQSTSTAAPSSSKTAASAEYSAWTTTDTRIKPSITTIPDDLYMDDETTADEQAYSSGEEVGRDHIPTVNLRQSWWKPLTEDRPASSKETVGLPSQKVQSQQDKSRDEYKILDEERRGQKQGVHVRYPETAKDTTYLPESGKLCWWTDSRRRLPVSEENRIRGSKYERPNITMEEYIRLEEEKSHRRGKVYNWETATYGKSSHDEDVHDLRSVETKFPAIIFNDELTSEEALSCKPTVSPLNDNQIDFRIHSENDNDKVNMPSFPSPEPVVNYSNDLGFFKDFENAFPSIVYNDALTFKSIS